MKNINPQKVYIPYKRPVSIPDSLTWNINEKIRMVRMEFLSREEVGKRGKISKKIGKS